MAARLEAVAAARADCGGIPPGRAVAAPAEGVPVGPEVPEPGWSAFVGCGEGLGCTADTCKGPAGCAGDCRSAGEGPLAAELPAG